jgi:hypothetical protein
VCTVQVIPVPYPFKAPQIGKELELLISSPWASGVLLKNIGVVTVHLAGVRLSRSIVVRLRFASSAILPFAEGHLEFAWNQDSFYREIGNNRESG